MITKRKNKKIKQFDKIRVSVNGRPTKFKVGDHIKLSKNDTDRIVTQISVDSDCCVQYLMTFMTETRNLASQWVSEKDINIMESLDEPPKVIGF